MNQSYPVIIIGAGQAGLSVAYFLKRKKINFVILDKNDKPGGSWVNTWPSLKLFSPAEYSSLSGWPLPKTHEEYPSKDEFIDYLTRYERRYQFDVKRNTEVYAVRADSEGGFGLDTSSGVYSAKAVVVATGTARGAFTPKYRGVENFEGEQIHSIDYRGPEAFKKKKVLVVGAGNTGAQIFSELIGHTETTWASKDLPVFLPDHLDGRYLFNEATKEYLSIKENGSSAGPKIQFGNIVMVESVKKVRDRNLLQARIADFQFYNSGVVWGDGSTQPIDSIIWSTGFKPNLDFLWSLGIAPDTKVPVDGTRAIGMSGLWLVGLGDWTGYASATIYGVGKTAKNTVDQIKEYLTK